MDVPAGNGIRVGASAAATAADSAVEINPPRRQALTPEQRVREAPRLCASPTCQPQDDFACAYHAATANLIAGDANK